MEPYTHSLRPIKIEWHAVGERQRPRSYHKTAQRARDVQISSSRGCRRARWRSAAMSRCSPHVAAAHQPLLRATPAGSASQRDRSAMQASHARESSARHGAIAGRRVDSEKGKDAAREVVPACGAPPPTAPRATRGDARGRLGSRLRGVLQTVVSTRVFSRNSYKPR